MKEPNPITVDQFIKELNGQLKVYAMNVKHSKYPPRSFPEWYIDFSNGTLIGTEYEEELYGPRILNNAKS